MKHAVYQHISSEGLVIYVGASADPATRMKQHRASSKWWGDVSSVNMSWHKNQEAALNKEAWEIFVHQPKFNKRKALSRVAHMLRCNVRSLRRGALEKKKIDKMSICMTQTAPQKIKQWLTDEGRKATWLAKKVPVDRATLSLWINGRQVPREIYRARLKELTGLDVVAQDLWPVEAKGDAA